MVGEGEAVQVTETDDVMLLDEDGLLETDAVTDGLRDGVGETQLNMTCDGYTLCPPATPTPSWPD